MPNEKNFWLIFYSFIHSFIYFIISLVIVISINSCYEKQAPEPESSKQKNVTLQKAAVNNQTNFVIKKDTTKGGKKDTTKIGDGGIIVQPDAFDMCYKTVDVWKFDHYEAVPGKIVGIWAEENTYWQNTYKLDVFHDTLGYNCIITDEYHLSAVISTNYDRDHIMIDLHGCDYPYWQQAIQNTKPVWAYYADEQGSQHSCQVVDYWFSNVRSFLNNNGGSNIKIITGEPAYGDFDCYDQYVNTIMCTKYCIDPEWTCIFYDQRGRWTDFRNAWSSKFNMSWISSRLDNEEFDNLIGHASNLGLDGVWLFQADDTQASEATERLRIETFSLFAWKWGFLQRIDRKWVCSFRCINQNPCDCDPEGYAGGWILDDEYPTSETRIRSW